MFAAQFNICYHEEKDFNYLRWCAFYDHNNKFV